MKKNPFVIFLFCLLSTISMAQSKDEKKVSAAVEILKNAMVNADKQQLENSTAPELTYGHSSGKMEDRTAFIDALVSGRSDFLTIDLTDQKIIMAGKTAIVRHVLSGTTKDNGVPGTVKLGVMLVWQKQNGSWKLLARQAYKL